MKKRDIADILIPLDIFDKVTFDVYKQYYFCHTGLLLYISAGRYFTEYMAVTFSSNYEYMTEPAIELYGNIFL